MTIQQLSLFLGLAMIAWGARGEVEPVVALPAQPFPLSQVRLLDSPFRDAMLRDGNYLLSLEPDRLLSWFRKEAGLQPKGEVYGGWESKGIAGHTLGHYLSACSLMYASTGDRRFLDRVNYIVGELAICQQANGNGYVAAIPDGRRFLPKSNAAKSNHRILDSTAAGFPGTTCTRNLRG